MRISSAMLFYQLAKKCDFVEKRAPSNKLDIENIRFYNGRTEIGSLYLVDCKRLEKAIVAKKPCTLIFINAEELNRDYIPKNCDYAIFANIRNFFDLAEIIYECIDDLQTWDCKLKDGIVQRIPLDEFGALGKEIINEPLYVMTHNFSVLALSGQHGYKFLEEGTENEGAETAIHKSNFGQSLSVKYVRRLISDKDYENSLTITDDYLYTDVTHTEYLCMNIMSGNRYIARLLAPTTYYNGELDEGFVQLFKHYFSYLKQIYLRYTDDPLIKNSSDKLHMLIDEMLFSPGSIDDVEANLILQNYSWSRHDNYTVIKFTFFKNSKWDEMTEYIRGKLEETWSNSCAIIHEDYIVWVFNHSISKNSEDRRRFFHVLAYILRDFVCKAGVSDEFDDINRVASYLTQANMALVTGQKNDPEKWYFRFQDYALDYMYDCVMAELSYDQLISESVRKLIDYDKKNNTEYLKTLRCFIKNNCNSTHTAEELYIHRTTLIRRIERISELCDIDFDDPDTNMYLSLSFLILHKMNFDQKPQ